MKALLDVPCGDFFWMREVELDGIDYLGGDIVADVVESNKRYETDSVKFVVMDLVNDPIPFADLVLVRDCLVHLSHEDVLKGLRNIAASKATYLLTTTFPGRVKNIDIPTGEWRPLNLEVAPFHLPPPREIITEQHPDPMWSDKSLGLWEVAQIRAALG